MRTPFLTVLIVAASLLPPAAALAQFDDVAGAKDHPMLTRYPGSFITEYEQNYDSVEFLIVGAAGKPATRKTIEGEVTRLRYFYEDPAKQPSALQLLRNYQSAIRKIGGTVVYERLPREGDGGETTLSATAGGKEVWIKVTPDIFGAPTQSYQLVFAESAALEQVVTANQLLDELNRSGMVALYINFDTGKSDLKSDGTATVAEIVKLMQDNPELSLGVEGHTDNVGNPEANQALSLARASSVVNAIVASGIPVGRLSSAGFGQQRPVADNRSEAGRAKNRRVELVKR